MIHGLYGITDPILMETPRSMIENVEAALKGGMRVLQYRDKQANHQDARSTCNELRELCHHYGATFIVNDNPELAKSSLADGVHLGRDDSSYQHARQLLGNKAIIGLSCYNDLSLAQKAQTLGADYVAFGAFFASTTKPNARQAPLEIITQAKQIIQCPLVAIGGITLDNCAPLITQGVDALAVIKGLFGVQDIEQTAKRFCSALA